MRAWLASIVVMGAPEWCAAAVISAGPPAPLAERGLATVLASDYVWPAC